ncbi:helix-turn-helix domain-containing protein [Desulfosporosinus metallidurans]|uniref:Helix-turn-helix domain-containing protein n=1 Tax=Desulfosporosinus metallidurans TaxID=1888891 RepID=A0A1Q8QRJ6_9FIRM|nr:helix-turn-helix domain-containing protein [Desulfosporosinus metallidurans]OLN29947.1 hypothetical protein DSOL_3287 [Desulfosporosinus metallidurans]
MKEPVSWDRLPEVISSEEAAAIARIGRVQIYKLAKQDGFPCVWFGKKIRISRDLFRKWIETNGQII